MNYDNDPEAGPTPRERAIKNELTLAKVGAGALADKVRQLESQVATLTAELAFAKSQRDDNENAWQCEKAAREAAEQHLAAYELNMAAGYRRRLGNYRTLLRAERTAHEATRAREQGLSQTVEALGADMAALRARVAELEADNERMLDEYFGGRTHDYEASERRADALRAKLARVMGVLYWMRKFPSMQLASDQLDEALRNNATTHEATRAQLQDMTQQWQKLATTTAALRAKLELGREETAALRARVAEEHAAFVNAHDAIMGLARDNAALRAKLEAVRGLAISLPSGDLAVAFLMILNNHTPIPEPPAVTQARDLLYAWRAGKPYPGEAEAWLCDHPEKT